MIHIIYKCIDHVVSSYINLLNQHRINYTIMPLEQVSGSALENCVPVIASIDRKTLEHISIHLSNNGVLVYDTLIKENLLSKCGKEWLMDRNSPIYYRIDHKALCAYLEVQIADHCNLKCRGCMHFSNIVDKPAFFPINSFEEDLQIMSDSLEILKFRIMGGEPLLNHNFEKYVILIREFFPKSKIIIVTNGLLLDKIPFGKLNILSEYQCEIDISIYPIIKEKLYKTTSILEMAKLKYRLIGDTKDFSVSFMKQLSLNPKYKKRCHERCSCNFWSEHKLSRCCLPSTISYYNECFGNSFVVDTSDFFEINHYFDGYSCMAFLQREMEFCKYCISQSQPITWKPFVDSRNAGINDYIVI